MNHVKRFIFDLAYESPSYIVDNIYLGNVSNAVDTHKIQGLNIGMIISIMNEHELKRLYSKMVDANIRNIIHASFTARDDTDVDIMNSMVETFFVINNFRLKYPNKFILIHCKAGISRSASLVLAYIILQYKLTLKRALEYVISRRGIVQPNPGFINQLLEIERLRHLKPLALYSSILMHKYELDAPSAIKLARRNMDELRVY